MIGRSAARLRFGREMPPTAPIPIAAVLIAKNRRRDILFLIRVMISLRIFDAPCRLRADMCASADGPHKQTVVDFQNKCLLMASALPLKYRTSARAPLTALGQHYRVAGVRGRGRDVSSRHFSAVPTAPSDVRFRAAEILRRQRLTPSGHTPDQNLALQRAPDLILANALCCRGLP